MTSESAVALAPPESPLPAPRATTGMLWALAYATALETSSVDFARSTRAAGW